MRHTETEPEQSPFHPPKTFMLVHGAWHGAWVWNEVARILRSQGHTVYIPTLTGLGERASLLSNSVTLDTFINDIEQAILHPQSSPALLPIENADTAGTRQSPCAPERPLTQHPDKPLTNVILVGHSFAGLVITGVADRIAAHLDRLIYLDAFLLPSGQSTFDTLPEKVVDAITMSAGAGAGIPPPDPVHLGIPKESENYAWVQQRLTPHPLATYASALNLKSTPGAGLQCCYLSCTEPAYRPVAASRDWAQMQSDWLHMSLASSHSAPVLAPDLVASALAACAAK
ncbi:esterase [Advenella kashmirensis W13003]|uniref:Esterase n=1 Tax=Advenella kashmirensis W13003 TaxID=1424334 RepID=V8QRY6_9BURK|nr:alpha/beta fold hydrolase [Advenella kashmirensis]ETF02065.1 esterase [Advenella kashmirensis W13003]